MDKKKIYHIVEWTVAIAACGYLVWRLATYEDYAALGESLRAMGWKEWGALALALALMPVNMAIEAWRWKTLMNSQFLSLKGTIICRQIFTMHNAQLSSYNISFREAQRQVYYSKLAGLITPWRLGEYPARAILIEGASQESRVKSQETIWPKVLSMGAVGSATMTAAIIIAGVGGLVGLDDLAILDSLGYYFLIGAVLVLLVVALYFAPQLMKRWATVSHRLVAISLGQSFVRLVCWCVQLGLVLYALGAVTGYGLWVTGARCFVYYLFVTITPNVPVAEVGVRGSWAIVLFGTVNAALAGVLLWVINTLLPCLVWPFLRKNTK